jgi:two-component system sensor histidine kinase CreC
MTILLRLALAVGGIFAISGVLMIRTETDQLKRRSREATEEALVDFAASMRAMIGNTVNASGQIEARELAPLQRVNEAPVEADIYGLKKKTVDTAILVFDRRGLLIFDSSESRKIGESYATWRDITLALKGRYGARTTSDREDGCSTMYASLPIYGQSESEVIGVISAAKPTCTSNLLVSRARQQVILLTATISSGAACVGFLVLFFLTRPLRRLALFVRSIRDGDPQMVPRMPTGELRDLLEAIEEMRRAIDGSAMTARYMQTISHELKSPLTAIRGAVEVLQEVDGADLETRGRFLKNIDQDTDRILILVDNLITLNSLGLHESRIPDKFEKNSVEDVLDEVVGRVRTQAEAHRISLVVSHHEEGAIIQGSRFLIREALTNVLRNAIAFSPEGESVSLSVSVEESSVQIIIRDHGPGIPSWALPRIFDQFFSLPRPASGHRSSGLGLPITREAIALLGGRIEVANEVDGGVVVKIDFIRG